MISWKTMTVDKNAPERSAEDLEYEMKRAYDLPFSTNWRCVPNIFFCISSQISQIKYLNIFRFSKYIPIFPEFDTNQRN